MTTIAEMEMQESEKIKRWEANNPNRKYIDYDYSEPKIYLEHRVRNTPAFRSLNKAAMLTYLEFLALRWMRPIQHGRVKKYRFMNNGYIVFPYSKAVEMGLSRQSFVNAIDELQAKGFIDITHQGRGGRKPRAGEGDFSTYKLDDRFMDFDEEKNVSRLPPKNPRTKDNRYAGLKRKVPRKKTEKNNYKSKKWTPTPALESNNWTPKWQIAEAGN